MPTPSRTSPLWNTRPTQPRAAAGAPASQGNPCALDCRRKACSSAPGAPSTLQGSPCQARRASPRRFACAFCLQQAAQGPAQHPAPLRTCSCQAGSSAVVLQSGRACRSGAVRGGVRRDSHARLRGGYLARWPTSSPGAAAPWCAAGRRPPHHTGAPTPARSKERRSHRRSQQGGWACKPASAVTTALQGSPRREASTS